MQDSWGSLIPFLLIIFIIIFFILWFCIKALTSKMERRINERFDENNFIENGLNTDNDDFIHRRIEPSAPLEEIYSIENTPNMNTTDTKPPPYSEIMEKRMDLNEPPPSYLESFKVSKFNTLV